MRFWQQLALGVRVISLPNLVASRKTFSCQLDKNNGIGRSDRLSLQREMKWFRGITITRITMVFKNWLQRGKLHDNYGDMVRISYLNTTTQAPPPVKKILGPGSSTSRTGPPLAGAFESRSGIQSYRDRISYFNLGTELLDQRERDLETVDMQIQVQTQICA